MEGNIAIGNANSSVGIDNIAMEFDDVSKEYHNHNEKNIRTNVTNDPDLLMIQKRSENIGTLDPDQEICGDDYFPDIVIDINRQNFLIKKLIQVEESVNNFLRINQNMLSYALYIGIFILYNAFFVAALYAFFMQDKNCTKCQSIEWCDGVGWLIVMTIMTYLGLIYYKLIKPSVSQWNSKNTPNKTLSFLFKIYASVTSYKYFRLILYTVIIAAFMVFIINDSSDDNKSLISALGIFIIILFGFAISKHRSMIYWPTVFWGLVFQFVFGYLILRWPIGQAVFFCLGKKISTFLAYTDVGSEFVYGYLITNKPFATYKLNSSGMAFQMASEINSHQAFGFIFYFKVLSVIYFFSFCVSMLFYLNVMQFVVAKIGWLLQITLGTTSCESLNAAGNIFLGQTEAPLLIRPYLYKMTNSEIHAVMTGGFATIAGGVFAAYISFGVSASHLLSASIMSAPAALACSKLIYPETKISLTSSSEMPLLENKDANILDAATKGASAVTTVVINITASLISFLAFVAFINGIFEWSGSLVGVEGFTFEFILGKIFIPLTWTMGVETEDLEKVSILIGLKSIVNEFAAYQKLQEYIRNNALSERSTTIATYALCGFSNPSSIGIQLAGLGTIAPSRRGDLSKVVVRAIIAGSLACFLTACVAGTLIKHS